jgi:hypothetical protein
MAWFLAARQPKSMSGCLEQLLKMDLEGVENGEWI